MTIKDDFVNKAEGFATACRMALPIPHSSFIIPHSPHGR